MRSCAAEARLLLRDPVAFACGKTERELLWIGAFVRVFMILYSAFHDRMFAVHYTDIDYEVVTDGARAMWAGFPSAEATPYARVTYRYTPLLALAMIPNVAFFFAFGKFLLAATDLAAAYYAFDWFQSGASSSSSMLLLGGPGSGGGGGSSSTRPSFTVSWTNPKFLVSALLLLNPVVINVSTRGNSDMLVTFLVLMALSNFARRNYVYAGASLGVAIHVKIFPVIFVPCFVFALLHRTASMEAKTSSPTPRQLLRAVLDKKFLSAVVLAAGALVTSAGLLTYACYRWYGQQYLQEAVLYHVGRLDHRHNFSPYWYSIYLGMAGRDVPGALGEGVPTTDAWLKTGLAAFLPQFGALLGVGWLLRRNVAHAVTVATMVFVTFNKVCTVQYFVWFIPLLPLVFATTTAPSVAPPATPGGSWWWAFLRAAALPTLWFLGIVLWMFASVAVEFDGKPAFVQLWLASLVFFALQTALTRRVAKWAWDAQKGDLLATAAQQR